MIRSNDHVSGRNPAARLARSASAILLVATATTAGAGVALADVVAEPIGAFQNPVYVTVSPNFKKLLYVVERAGRVRVLHNEKPRKRAFLNIRKIVRGPPDDGAGGEQGLLSIAFAPKYKTSRRFYVAFTNKKGDLEVDEFRRSKSSKYRANPKSRRKLLTVRHRDAQNHNGGQLQFGPDGKLYISTGDGGGGGDGFDNARKKGKLLGKLLRINPRKGESTPYRIPKSNPFVNAKGRDEIYSYGLRNPWRFSFDGDTIVIADVGQNKWEEVNLLGVAAAKGANFGWPQYEGNEVFDADRPGEDPPSFPEHVYSHGGGSCSITGDYVVRDPDVPDLAGRYIYGDYCTGRVRSFIAAEGAPDDRSEGLTLSGLSSFGEGHGGQIYTVQLSGTVSRIESTP